MTSITIIKVASIIIAAEIISIEINTNKFTFVFNKLISINIGFEKHHNYGINFLYLEIQPN
jgi:hypothetical protein